MTTTKENRGFTLIELMITLVVVAILAALAAPSFSDMIRDHRLMTQANILLSNLQLARTEAITRGAQVTMRHNGNNAAGWGSGWQVFTDWDQDGQFDGDEDETDCSPQVDCILTEHAALGDGLTLQSGGTIAQWLAYRPTGSLIGSGGLGNDAFRLCDREADTAFSREITLISTGRAVVNASAAQCP